MKTIRSMFGATALAVGLSLLAAPTVAFAQDDEDDVLSDILGGTDSEDLDGDLGDLGLDPVDVADREKRIIKTIQQKNFLKLGRWELSPHAAFVSNDPFLNRYIAGIGVGYHLTEIFAIEAMVDFSPDLGEGDWKPLTTQLVEENEVSPDISKLGLFGSACFVFSPIYGKAAISGNNIINFDIYGKFGMGATNTSDDLDALQAAGEASAIATENQIHPTTNFGGGVRVVFNSNFALRVEGRSMIYIETIDSDVLEMKNNFIIQAGASFFIPTMKKDNS
ncbi:MAG: outer membrane beta-barrel domain-containing protein [Myxococcota bacterium]